MVTLEVWSDHNGHPCQFNKEDEHRIRLNQTRYAVLARLGASLTRRVRTAAVFCSQNLSKIHDP